MIKSSYSFSEFNISSSLIRDLVNESDSVKHLIDGFFKLSSLEQKIAERKKTPINRAILFEAASAQNASLQLSEKTRHHLHALQQDNCFTITTGHQLNLFGGPLFSVYKIVQTIVLAQEARKRYPTVEFVPVFWMASEDHDFDEINHFHLFGKKLIWQKSDQEQVVAGRLNTSGLNEVLNELEALFKNPEQRQLIEKFTQIYRQSKSLGQATRHLVNALFGEYGLVIIDGDDALLKKLFEPVLSKELEEHISYNCVSETNNNLGKLGYHQQVHARECNLFYIHDEGKRERIVYENDEYKIANEKYTREQLSALAKNDSARFSPNALLRPVYQEIILPNLVYVGGGGEIAYWLQLNGLFEKLNLSFPFLRVRDSVFVMNQRQVDDLEAVGIGLTDLQKNADQLLTEITKEEKGETLSLKEVIDGLNDLREKTLAKVAAVDPGLKGLAEAEYTKVISAIEKLEAKLIKAEKSKDEVSKNRIIKLQDKLFPDGHFQERHDNVLHYLTGNTDFIDQVMKIMVAEDKPQVRTLIQ